MIMDNAYDAAVFFPNINTSIFLVRDYMGFSAALSTYLFQKSRGLILIISRNRNVVSRLTERSDRIFKIE
jgi:hypothetical protein